MAEHRDDSRTFAFLVDSSALRTKALEEYLCEHPSNLAIISEVTAFEPYRNRRPQAIGRNLEICCRYPGQLRVLRGTIDIIASENEGPVSAVEYIDPRQTAGSAEFCAGLDRAIRGDVAMMKAMEAHVAAADAHLTRLKAQMGEVAEGLKDFGRMLGVENISALRRNELYPPQVLERSWWFITELARGMFAQNYGDKPFDAQRHDIVRRLLFRFAAAGTVLALWWTRHGGLESVRSDRLANDLIDLQQVALALKFDGLITEDAKLMDIYSETGALIQVLEESLGVGPDDRSAAF